MPEVLPFDRSQFGLKHYFSLKGVRKPVDWSHFLDDRFSSFLFSEFLVELNFCY